MFALRVKKVASPRKLRLNWAIVVCFVVWATLLALAGNHLKCCCLQVDDLLASPSSSLASSSSISPFEELQQAAGASSRQQFELQSLAPRLARDGDGDDRFESKPSRNIYAHHHHRRHQQQHHHDHHHRHQHKRTLKDASGNSEKVIRDNSNNNDNHNNGHWWQQRRQLRQQQQDQEAAATSASMLVPARVHGRERHMDSSHNNRQSSANLARTTIAFAADQTARRNDELDDLRRPQQQRQRQQRDDGERESSSGLENDQRRLASAPSDHSSAVNVTRITAPNPTLTLTKPDQAADNQAQQDAGVDSSSSSEGGGGAESNSLIESERAALDELALDKFESGAEFESDQNEPKLAARRSKLELARPTTFSLSVAEGHYGAQAGALADHRRHHLTWRRFKTTDSPEAAEWAAANDQHDSGESVGAEVAAPQLAFASSSSPTPTTSVECQRPTGVECPRGRHHRRHYCGSDGCIYGSLCELRRASCKLGRTVTHMRGALARHCKRVQCATTETTTNASLATVTSTAVPLSAKTIIKAKTNGRRVKEERRRQSDNYYGDHLIAESSSGGGDSLQLQPQLQLLARSHANGTEASGAHNWMGDVKCTPSEYRDFKLALWHEFNESAQLLFHYLDLNANGLVEARELWPRGDTRPLQFTSSGRQLGESSHRIVDHNGRLSDNKTAVGDYLTDQVEFAFKPRYLWNPCSLSHLMSFELVAQGDQFELASLERAFGDLGQPKQLEQPKRQEGSQKVLQERQTDTTSVLMQLGESQLLECLSNELLVGLSETISSSVTSRGSERLTSNDIVCLWSRHAINLETINDEHVELIGGGKRQLRGWLNESIEAAAAGVALHLKDAQLYLSGQYECACQVDKLHKSFVHKYSVQVAAKPRVLVRPASQWSLPNSRISFECHHDYIDTSLRLHHDEPLDATGATRTVGTDSYYKVDWLKVDEDDEAGVAATIVDSSELATGFGGADSKRHFDWMWSPSKQMRVANCSDRAAITTAASRLVLERLQANDTGLYKCRVRVSLSTSTSQDGLKSSIQEPAGGELSSENHGHLLVQDQMKIFEPSLASAASDLQQSATMAQGQAPALAALEVGDIGFTGQVDNNNNNDNERRHLWLFHESGISVYKLTNEDGQELELVHELSGHSEVSGEVDGNWNQLTLCGGLSQEQVVICEWSDNAIEIIVPIRRAGDGSGNTGNANGQPGGNSALQQDNSYQLFNRNQNQQGQRRRQQQRRGSTVTISKYIYIGQPNLNRVIVLDASEFTIVAIVNTEPQPRKLFAFKPNKIHLNKWVRRRLSPPANARWLQAIERHHHTAHPLELTPKSSRLHSDKRSYDDDSAGGGLPTNRRTARQSGAGVAKPSSGGGPFLSPPRAWQKQSHGQSEPNQAAPKLVQHDIWLLCYGQPLVVDPARDSSELELEEEAIAGLNSIDLPRQHHQKRLHASSMDVQFDGNGNYYQNGSEERSNKTVQSTASARPFRRPLVSAWPLIEPLPPSRYWPRRAAAAAEDDADSQSTGPGQHGDREARLRNRKSVQIIQSTFFADRLAVSLHSNQNHNHNSADDGDTQSAVRGDNRVDDESDDDDDANQKNAWWSMRNSIQRQPAALPGLLPPTPQASQSIPSATPVSRSVISEFKRLAVLTTHYVTAARGTSSLASANKASDAAAATRAGAGGLDRMVIGSEAPVEFGSAPLLSPAAAMRLARSAISAPVGDNDYHHNYHSHHHQQFEQGQLRPVLGELQRQFSPDLVQDLSVPARPHSLINESRFKLHYAYATHYNDRLLYRIAMDSYHYDRAIDLNDCDPISMLTAAQGLLIVQCRAHITHQLIGQLVLDELTSGKIQFNDNIRAQVAYLSPDSKYLISVYTGTTATATATSAPVARETTNSTTKTKEEQEPSAPLETDKRKSTIIYVQLVSVNGLSLQYEIKTSLEISQCSFVWKDGYYAAVFVALNRRDQQIELLSLRLADSRLELMVRVPGLVTTTTRHREALNILPDLKLASLSTTDGTYIVDLEENRVTQTLNYHHRHQSSPTFLWV